MSQMKVTRLLFFYQVDFFFLFFLFGLRDYLRDKYGLISKLYNINQDRRREEDKFRNNNIRIHHFFLNGVHD